MPATGIGGFFFGADDPSALTAGYQKHLGVGSYNPVWMQAAGPTIISPFPKTTDYFPAEKQWMLNLRVSDLDVLVQELAAAGVEVRRDPDWDTPETGRFARIHDPEGNPIELWEPPPD